jgi:aspartate dehydrogenase
VRCGQRQPAEQGESRQLTHPAEASPATPRWFSYAHPSSSYWRRHGIYIPSGALWGARDIQNMASRGNLCGLTVTMKKAPHHLKLLPPLSDALTEIVASGAKGESVLYDGPVRGLAPLAPNNTNTMAAAALAAHNLGMDGTRGRLIADPDLEAHIVEVEVEGAGKPGAPPFRCVTRRFNPAESGAVTGDATYASFMSSILDAGGRGDGLHFC